MTLAPFESLFIIKVLQGDENYVNWRSIARESSKMLDMIW